MPARARVLFLKGRAKSYDPMADCLADIADTKYVSTLASFQKLAVDKTLHAILCTATFHGGTYRDVLLLTQRMRLDIPVIVCAEEDGDQEWVEALEHGAFDLLVAPFQKDAVARVIEEALESREARREFIRVARPFAHHRRHSA